MLLLVKQIAIIGEDHDGPMAGANSLRTALGVNIEILATEPLPHSEVIETAVFAFRRFAVGPRLRDPPFPGKRHQLAGPRRGSERRIFGCERAAALPAGDQAG